ncbi:MAG: PIG-L family deacetylase [Proteobacteria bacterium]|nr:PIG-L family deacetylase [Pseudomonadota bacterium]
MKLRVHFRPGVPVALLTAAAGLFWLLAWAAAPGGLALAAGAVAVFYSLLAAIGLFALARIARLERWQDWNEPVRLLILAPHEDDCTIGAGGVGARNRRLGGATRIVYLAADEAPGMAERRAAEARAAWALAGVPEEDVLHVDLLPPFRHPDPARLRAAARALRRLIDEFAPAVIVVPMFEGGHVHHDMTAALVAQVRTAGDRFTVLEAPEYGPYTSLLNTPHRILALCTRWLFGLVSYYGPPDGVDGRPILKVRLDAADLDCKRRMLATFESQNGPSLATTKGYPDRFAQLDPRILREPAFALAGSYLAFVRRARAVLPPAIVDRLLPVQLGTIGREHAPTLWSREWEGTP